MITLLANRFRQCDGITRRSFLTAGSLGVGGLTLAQLLCAESRAGIGSSQKAVINVHLDGGPPQMDMIDLKLDAPAEIRGEFSPISTAISGFQICELMPKIAAAADKFVFIRSLVGADGAHNAFQCQSGFMEKELKSVGGWPAMGAVLASLRGSSTDDCPSFVDLMQGRPLVRNSARAGFLGAAYQPFRPDISQMFSRPLEDGMKKELAARGGDHTTPLTLAGELDQRRVSDRAGLLSWLDRTRREVDSSGMMDAIDQFTQQAIGILLSGRFADAMDLTKEDPGTLARYTASASNTATRFVTSDDPRATRKLLLARRLVEAGVRCVSVSFSDFDTHGGNFTRLRQLLPMIDHGLHALVTDLDERGMLDDVSIVVWGEFGRTPKINSNAGRDHWPRVGMALLAGGGMRTGQVIGATDRFAATAVSRPVHYQDVFATLYHNLGINAKAATITDPNGRPHYLVERGEPIGEVL
jgi:hypothetical protein